jgi:DNA-binding NarL/FixJ family response regulator
VFERGRTLLAYGAKLHRLRRQAEARRMLRAALELFEGLGADAWTELARAELRKAGGRIRVSGDGLTPAERRVAEVVARGASNREAASELFLSEKTVEFHLGQIYRKLGVRSRTQLTLAVRGEASSDLDRSGLGA